MQSSILAIVIIIYLLYRDSSIGRATVSKTVDVSSSLTPYANAQVAQSVEHSAVNRVVAGSSPALSANALLKRLIFWILH